MADGLRAAMNRRTVLRLGASFGALSMGALAACSRADAPINIPGAAPEAMTKAGAVRGSIDSGITVFRGIRYGAPTQRFMPPTPPEPWNEPQDALDFRAQAPQAAFAATSLLSSWSNARPNSEDCLFLNVWTPDLKPPAAGPKRPVMVWIHAGSYAFGSGAWRVSDGTRLCKRGDVVVVTINHRLNAFGHLYLAKIAPDLPDSGNTGLLDLVLALQWVRDNIEAFGGDPANITLFGEDSGANKVATLMAMPMAKGLFHRAVMQSPLPILRALTPDEATVMTTAFLAKLGLSLGEAEAIKSMAMEDITAQLGSMPRFRPVLDGRALSRHPFEPDAPHNAGPIPMLIGTTRDESVNLIARGDPTLFKTTWADLPARLDQQLPGARAFIAPFRKLHPGASAVETLVGICSEATYRRAAIAQAERKAAQHEAAVFMYLVEWQTPVETGKWGSPHAVDVALTFDNVARSASMVGASAQDQAAAQIVADQMSAAWIAFARTGAPNTSEAPHWPPYDSETRATMVFNTISKIVNDPRSQERLMFANSGAS